jgi:hypothetical protein
MTARQRNSAVTVAFVLGVFVLCGFLGALMGSHSGEIAGALGNVVGGTIGALGAALAVYLALRGQQADETEKISTAITMEVAQLVKFLLGQLETCRAIYQGKLTAARNKLPSLMQIPEPTLYKAAAEHISRVSRPALVVAFYTGLAETQAAVNVVLANRPTEALLEPIDVEGIGILLLEQCMIARQILAHARRPEQDTELIRQMLIEIIRRLDEEIETSKKAFPTAHAYEKKTTV